MKITDHIYMIGSSEHGLSGPGDCHVYLVDTDAGLVLIDAGGCDDDRLSLVETVRRDGLDPTRLSHILLTHAHRDHAGGLDGFRRLAERGVIGSVISVTSDEEARLLEFGSGEELGLDRIGLRGRSRADVFPPVSVDKRVADGESLRIGSVSFTCIVVPGHSPGCVCYALTIDGRNVLFSGDVVFHGGYISVGNWPGSSSATYRESLHKLSGLGIDALFPSHHMWTLTDGQTHIDRAVEAFTGPWPPPAVSQILGG